MSYCPDNYDQWVKLDEEQYERDQRRPRCAECGEPIRYVGYRIGGEMYCEECVENGREYVDDSDRL
jgi:formylmethanofuran dehydrogenase subunit E